MTNRPNISNVIIIVIQWSALLLVTTHENEYKLEVLYLLGEISSSQTCLIKFFVLFAYFSFV